MDKPEKEKERRRSDSCGVMLALMPRIRALYSVPREGGRSGSRMEGRRWRKKAEEEGERGAEVANGGKGCPYSREMD